MADDERWAQLTYASFDTGSGGGGWQIKDQVGDAEPVEILHLRDAVVTSIAPLEAPPRFPTDQQILALERKFRVRPLEIGSTLYVHAAQAGLDGTGRPGNVFSHIALDRFGDRADHRPVDLWWSPSWLRPFGHDQVLDAVAPVGIELPDRAAVRREVVDFLLDPEHWRGGILRVLLDAVASALDGGPSVVLGVADDATAARWIAAVSYLTTPAHVRELGWSVSERAGDLAAALDDGLKLIAVRHADLDQIEPRRGVLVLDDRESPRLGDLGGEGHEAGTQTVVVTPWSELASAALLDDQLIMTVLAAIDDVGERLGDIEVPLEWPLAMVIVTAGEAFAAARPQALEVLRAKTPMAVSGLADLWAPAARALAPTLGETAADAWQQVRELSAVGGGVMLSLAVGEYTRRALDDPGWLVGEWQADAYADQELATFPDVEVALERSIDRLSQSAPVDERAFAILRVADFAARSALIGQVPERLPELARRLHQLVETVAVEALLGDGAAGLLAKLSNAHVGLRSAWVRPAVAESGRGPADVAPELIDWIFPDPSWISTDPTVPLDPFEEAWFRRRLPVPGFNPQAWAARLAVQLPADPALDAVLFQRATWTAELIVEVERLAPRRVPERMQMRALSSGAGAASLELAHRFLDDPARAPEVRAAAMLTAVASGLADGGAGVRQQFGSLADTIARGDFPRVELDAVTAPVVPLIAAFAIAEHEHVARSLTEQTFAALRRVSPTQLADVADHAMRADVIDRRIARQLLWISVRASIPGLGGTSTEVRRITQAAFPSAGGKKDAPLPFCDVVLASWARNNPADVDLVLREVQEIVESAFEREDADRRREVLKIFRSRAKALESEAREPRRTRLSTLLRREDRPLGDTPKER